jgi:peptidoglycan/LPS O-acetylase OafA/YrhL
MSSAPRLALGPGAVRLILALMVFVSHVSVWKIGTAAVVLFLMLSGYWVSRIYLQGKYDGVGQYLAGRVLRLWPLVIVAALMAWGIQMAVRGYPMGNLASTIFFLGIASRGDDVVGTVWSLDIELQFYLLLPLVMAGLAAAGRRWRLALALGAILALLAGIWLGRAGWLTALIFAPAFATGIWMERSQWAPRRGPAMLSLGAFLVVLGLYARLAPPDVETLMALGIDHFSLATLLVAVLAVPFIAWNVHQPSGPGDRWLGDLSYPFYLLHFPLIWGLTQLMGDTGLMKIVALAVSLTLTVAVNLWIDRPIEAWRRRRLQARRAGAA